MHCFDSCLHIYEKCLLALPRLSVRFSVASLCWPISLSASISSACTGRIFGKIDIGVLYGNLSRKARLVKIGLKYWALYMKTEVRIVVGNINLP